MVYYFKSSAVKDLKKLPKLVRKKILEKLDFYTKSSNYLQFVKPLKDKTLGEYRFRIGEYRIIFDFDTKNKNIIILAVGHRKDVYK